MNVTITQSQASMSRDAVLTTDYAGDYTTRGNSFLFEKNIAIANGATAYVLFDYKTFIPLSGQSGMIFVFPPSFQTTAGPVTVNLYRDTGYLGGTPVILSNPNTLAPKRASGTTVSMGPTGTNKGTLAMEYLVGGGSAGVGNSIAGSTEGLSFFIRNNTKKSLVEIINGAGTDIIFHYGQILYEI